VWAPACRRAGLEGLGFHDLRRTNAAMLMASGASSRDAQELLGHKDPRMLLGVYAQSTSEGKRAAVDRLTAALQPADEPPNRPRTAPNVPCQGRLRQVDLGGQAGRGRSAHAALGKDRLAGGSSVELGESSP